MTRDHAIHIVQEITKLPSDNPHFLSVGREYSRTLIDALNVLEQDQFSDDA